MYTLDEVDLIQNLMFYIEAAYKVAVSLSLNNYKHLVYMYECTVDRTFICNWSFLSLLHFLDRTMECGSEETRLIRAFLSSMPAQSAWPK